MLTALIATNNLQLIQTLLTVHTVAILLPFTSMFVELA